MRFAAWTPRRSLQGDSTVNFRCSTGPGAQGHTFFFWCSSLYLLLQQFPCKPSKLQLKVPSWRKLFVVLYGILTFRVSLVASMKRESLKILKLVKLARSMYSATVITSFSLPSGRGSRRCLIILRRTWPNWRQYLKVSPFIRKEYFLMYSSNCLWASDSCHRILPCMDERCNNMKGKMLPGARKGCEYVRCQWRPQGCVLHQTPRQRRGGRYRRLPEPARSTARCMALQQSAQDPRVSVSKSYILSTRAAPARTCASGIASLEA